LFEEKTALNKCYQYDGSADRSGPAWRSDVFDYFVSKLPAAGPWLRWAEQSTAEVTTGLLTEKKMSNDLMTDELNPTVLSHHIWAFFHHCLIGTAKQIFKATERQNGLEVWRRLAREINSRTDCVRHNLRNRCQIVSQASSNSQVWQHITNWETTYIEYLDAGGSEMNFEDRRGQILRMLPQELRRDLFRRIAEFKTVAAVKDWIREQLEMEKEWRDTDSRQMRGKQVATVELDNGEESDEETASELDMQALFALNSDSSMDEINAVQQRFRKFGRPGGAAGRGPKPAAGKGGGKGKGTGRGGGAGGAKLPGASSMRCINCGKQGHATSACPEQRRDAKQRPCFQCGKTGHVKAQCPALNKSAAIVRPALMDAVNFGRIEVEPAKRPVGDNGNAGTSTIGFSRSATTSGAAEEWKQPRNPVRAPRRPTPSSTTMGDYLRQSAFTRAARLEKAAIGALTSDDELCEALGVGNDDNEDWANEFEAKYTDVVRLKPKSKVKVATPKRGTPAKVEACHLAPLEVVYPDGAEILAAEAEAPRYKKIKVALDSGAGTHVINRDDAPGYTVRPSEMSQAGAAFLAADGGRIQNHGEVHVRMVAFDTKGGAHAITSRFEAADVTRALWSVGLICDAGLKVDFNSKRALVCDQNGNEVCVFERSNGLYVAEVEVENPESFHRPGR